jgi:hypothetical protein
MNREMGDVSAGENEKRAAAVQTRNAITRNTIRLSQQIQSYRNTLNKKLLLLKGVSEEKKNITSRNLGINALRRRLRSTERNLRRKTRSLKVENKQTSISPGLVRSRILMENPATKSVRVSPPYLAKVAEIETAEETISNPLTNSKVKRATVKKLQSLRVELLEILTGANSNPTYIRLKERVEAIKIQLAKRTTMGPDRVNLKEELKARELEMQDILAPQHPKNNNTNNNSNNERE